MASLDARSLIFGSAAVLASAAFGYYNYIYVKKKQQLDQSADGSVTALGDENTTLIPCLRARRSVFPRNYVDETVDKSVVESLLEAAMWAPFHGPLPPWRFVVLGRDAMVEMQRVTLSFYDREWQTVGWPGSGGRSADLASRKAEYEEWRNMTEEEITGRWGPVSYMIAIVMQRQAHATKRLPEWEEAAATACAVQNMYIQATAFPGLACYWSSWHDAARESVDLKTYLKMQEEDKCLGFFIVAACKKDLPDRRRRSLETHAAIEWRS